MEASSFIASKFFDPSIAKPAAFGLDLAKKKLETRCLAGWPFSFKGTVKKIITNQFVYKVITIAFSIHFFEEKKERKKHTHKKH